MPLDKPAAGSGKPPSADESLRRIRNAIDKVDVARKALLEDRRDDITALPLPAASRRRKRGYRPR